MSFFFDRSPKNEEDIENISISLHQEMHQLKKRLKTVEEELLIGVPTVGHTKKTKAKPIHEIIVNQILSLHAQGYSISEIAKRSSLPETDVVDVLKSRGVFV